MRKTLFPSWAPLVTWPDLDKGRMWTEVKGTVSSVLWQTRTGSPPAEASVDMKATFAIAALLVLALSWTGSGAVEVEVSEELEQEMFIVLDCKVLLISAQSVPLWFQPCTTCFLFPGKWTHLLVWSRQEAPRAGAGQRSDGTSQPSAQGERRVALRWPAPAAGVPPRLQAERSVCVSHQTRWASLSYSAHRWQTGGAGAVCTSDPRACCCFFQRWCLWISARSAPLPPALAVRATQLNHAWLKTKDSALRIDASVAPFQTFHLPNGGIYLICLQTVTLWHIEPFIFEIEMVCYISLPFCPPI